MRIIDDDSAHWHARAVNARARAEQMTTPEARRGMLEIALRYDLLAELAKQRIGTGET